MIREWCNYYRYAIAKRTFCALDNHVWRITYRWAKRRHPNKTRHWVVNRYFGVDRGNGWVRCDGRFRLPRHNETRVSRFVKVKGKVSPFDPSLRDYWEDRRLRRLVRDAPTRAGNRRNDLLADALALLNGVPEPRSEGDFVVGPWGSPSGFTAHSAPRVKSIFHRIRSASPIYRAEAQESGFASAAIIEALLEHLIASKIISLNDANAVLEKARERISSMADVSVEGPVQVVEDVRAQLSRMIGPP